MGYFFRCKGENPSGSMKSEEIKVKSGDEWMYQTIGSNYKGDGKYSSTIIYTTGGKIDVERVYSAQYRHKKWPEIYDRNGMPIKDEDAAKKERKKSKEEKESSCCGCCCICRCLWKMFCYYLPF